MTSPNHFPDAPSALESALDEVAQEAHVSEPQSTPFEIGIGLLQQAALDRYHSEVVVPRIEVWNETKDILQETPPTAISRYRSVGCRALTWRLRQLDTNRNLAIETSVQAWITK